MTKEATDITEELLKNENTKVVYNGDNTHRFIENKDEGIHVHQIKLDGDWREATGVSSVKSRLGAPLAWWASGEALKHLGWIHPGNKEKGFVKKEDRLNGMQKFLRMINRFTPADLLTLFDEAYRAHSRVKDARAEEGTDTHALLENYIKRCIKENDGYPMYQLKDPFIKKFNDLTKELNPRFIGSEVLCHDKDLFVAGITDVVVETNKGLGVWDLKTRKKIYDVDLIQMCAYSGLLGGGFTHVLGVAIPPEGEGSIRPFFSPDLGWQAFVQLLGVHRFLQSIES